MGKTVWGCCCYFRSYCTDFNFKGFHRWIRNAYKWMNDVFAYSFIKSPSITFVQFISVEAEMHHSFLLTIWRQSWLGSGLMCWAGDVAESLITLETWAADSRTRSIRDLVLSLKNVYLGPFVRLLRVTGYKEHLSISWISNCPWMLVLSIQCGH